MNGLYIQTRGTEDSQSPVPDLNLLAKHGKLEIMTQDIEELSVAWLAPAREQDAFEFYYLLSGELEVTEPDQTTTLRPGDSITLQGLTRNVMLRCTRKARMLCVTNMPVFTDNAYWQGMLMEQLKRIDAKDHYTLSHSKRVMFYCKKLYEAFREECRDVALDEFIVGCLFHDIGKINTPSAILSKPGRLTPEEYAIMKQHAAESEVLLTPLFGAGPARLARNHHERLNGSGYPSGLKGDAIDFPTRILMVADAFDAMTADRIYRKADSPETAALELAGLPEQFDSRITGRLLEMIRSGELKRENIV